MKRSLMRPTAALFPAVLLAAGMLGSEIAAANLFFCYCALQLFTLCSVGAFRNAAAREPGVKRVDRRFSGAWPVILLGSGVMVALECFVYGGADGLMGNIGLLIAAICIIIEQLFEERMFALSHPSDGVILGIVANVLLFAGMIVDAGGGVAAPLDVNGFYTACGAALGMLISIGASYIIEPMHAFSMIPRNIAFFPKAAAQCLLYPAAAYLLFHSSMEVLAGMIIWRLSRTVCRRANDESRPLNLLLVAVCGALAVASLWVPGLAAYANAGAIAMICALMLFCAPGWRIYSGAALVIAANAQLFYGFLSGNAGIIAVIAACAIAVVLNLHKAFLRKV